MKSLCVIGNSHIASLKQGWDRIARDYQDIELVFFGSPANSLYAMEVRGGSLVPGNKNLEEAFAFTSGGKREIVTAEYSAFLCYGMGLQLPAVEPGYSSAVWQAILRDSTTSSLNLTVARLLRKATPVPVHIGHNPQLATPRKANPAHSQSYAKVFDPLAKLLAADDFLLMPQPAATLDVDGWSTRPQFSAGSKRLVIGHDAPERQHPENERAHMNDVFGEMYLRELLPRVKWR